MLFQVLNLLHEYLILARNLIKFLIVQIYECLTVYDRIFE